MIGNFFQLELIATEVGHLRRRRGLQPYKISATGNSRKQFFTTKRGSTKFETKEVMLLGVACL
jgi:hypothetical protein